MISNPTVKHNFSQLLQRGGSDKVDAKDRALVAQLADLMGQALTVAALTGRADLTDGV